MQRGRRARGRDFSPRTVRNVLFSCRRKAIVSARTEFSDGGGRGGLALLVGQSITSPEPRNRSELGRHEPACFGQHRGLPSRWKPHGDRAQLTIGLGAGSTGSPRAAGNGPREPERSLLIPAQNPQRTSNNGRGSWVSPLLRRQLANNRVSWRILPLRKSAKGRSIWV